MRTAKNYTENGGDKTVIGGELEIAADATLTVKAGATVAGTVSAAVVDGLTSTSSTDALSANQGKVLNDAIVALGPVDALDSTSAVAALSAKQGKTLNDAIVAKTAAVQADSVATDVTGLVTDFNALLAKLRTAGLLATE